MTSSSSSRNLHWTTTTSMQTQHRNQQHPHVYPLRNNNNNNTASSSNPRRRTPPTAQRRKPQIHRKQSYLNAIYGLEQSMTKDCMHEKLNHDNKQFLPSYNKRSNMAENVSISELSNASSMDAGFRNVSYTAMSLPDRRKSDPFVLKLKRLIANKATTTCGAETSLPSFKVIASLSTNQTTIRSTVDMSQLAAGSDGGGGGCFLLSKDRSSTKARTLKEGHLCCKSVVIQNRRASDRSWRHGWAILRDNGSLYLYHASAGSMHVVNSPPIAPQKSSQHACSSSATQYTDPMGGVPFPVVNRTSQCHVQLASDYKKRQRVFRLITSEGCELLLQAPDAQNLCEWLFEIRRACGGHLLAPIGTVNRRHHHAIPATESIHHEQQQDEASSISCCSLPATATGLTTKTPLLSSTSTFTTSSSLASSLPSSSKNPLDIKEQDTSDNCLANKKISDSHQHQTSSKQRVTYSPIFSRRGVPACLRRSATVNNVELVRLMNPSNLVSSGKALAINGTNLLKSAVHSSSSSSSPSSKSTTDKARNFGIALDECEYGSMNAHVPLVVVILTKLIESCGIRRVGIYRQTGSVSTTAWMVGQLNKGVRNANFADARWNDTRAIASTLKCFFAKLPECLFSKVLYSDLIKSCKVSNQEIRLKTLKRLLNCLPLHSVHTLQFIANHFATVHCRSEFNKVDVHSLAIIFGPTLLWHPDKTLEGNLADNPEKVQIIETVVNYHSWIFDERSLQFDDSVPLEQECSRPIPSDVCGEAKLHDLSITESTQTCADASSDCAEPTDVVQAILENCEIEEDANREDEEGNSSVFVSNSSIM